MRDQLLDILKYAFLALVYLFLLNVVLTIRRELRDPPAPSLAGASGGGRRDARSPAPTTPQRSSRTKHTARLRIRGAAAAPIALVDQLTIGRSPGCGFVISGDSTVSGVHARVFRRGAEMWIEDLKSTNGTYVNGSAITAPMRVTLPCSFRCGDTELELVK